MMQSNNHITGSTRPKLYLYLIYWLIYLGFFSVQRFFAKQFILTSIGLEKMPGAFMESVFTNLIYLPEVIISTHFVVDFLLPRFYFTKRFYFFATLFGITIILYPGLPYLARTYVVEQIFPSSEAYSFYNYFAAMLIYVFGMAPLGWIRIAKHLREEARMTEQIDKDRLEALLKLKEAELKLLKNQIHPHFLFNTLNNIYSLALDKSEKTPDLILRLSDMLSYVIYDCKSEKVPLSKEVAFIRNYIELQRIRYDDCDVDFTVTGEIGNHQIAPMILHTFIDNSFKHGADKDANAPWIKMRLNFEDGILTATVVNSTARNGEMKQPGIGISNTRRRLDMIYKERYELVLDNSANKYSVFLKIQL